MFKGVSKIGKQFGDLYVIGLLVRTPNITDVNRYWLCQCVCGNTSIVSSGSLISGAAKSCGCRRTRLRLSDYEASLRRLIVVMQSNAKRRGHEWNLTKEDVSALIQLECFYCGKSPSQIIHPKSLNGVRVGYDKANALKYNGLDRLDNNIGYIRKNVVSCCGMCNWMKLDLSYEEFKMAIEKIFCNLVKH